MSLSTTQYGYIIDPMIPFTDDKGKTIKNGFIRVFMAGTSTPVLTYRNYDGATNQEKIELDNSGRVMHNVIGSKGSLYKVVVYNILHSQENPLLTVDKIAVLGASINASGATIVTGLDSVTVQEENFLKATVEGTGVELALDPTEVTSEVTTTAAAETAAPDYVVPLLDKTGTGDSKKISLANLFKFALDWISRLATTITSFASGDFIAVSNTTDGTRKMSKDTLLELTAQNALAGNVAPAFDPTRTSENPYKAGENVTYEGKAYTFKVDHYGPWASKDVYPFADKFIQAIVNEKKISGTCGKNIFNKNTINSVTGLYIGYNSGIAISSSSQFSAVIYVGEGVELAFNKDYINVSAFSGEIMLPYEQIDGLAIHGYIGGIATDSSHRTWTTPVGCKCIVVSMSSSKVDTLQVEIGSVPTAYEEYKLGVSQDDVFGLVGDLGKKLDGAVGKNLFNKNTENKTANNLYVVDVGGYVGTSSNYKGYVIEVEAGTVLSFNKQYIFVVAFNKIPDLTEVSSGDVIPGRVGGFNGEAKQGWTVPDGAVCIVVSCSNSNADSMQVEIGSSSTSYKPWVFGLPLEKVIGAENLSARTYFVGSGMQYETIQSAVNAVPDKSTIVIMPGTYNESIDVRTSGKTLHIVGFNRDKCVITHDIADYAEPPMEIGKGVIENITFVVTGTTLQNLGAYCVHVDYDSEENSALQFINCNFKNTLRPCIGIGLRSNFTLSFVACGFECYSSYGPIYCHEQQASNKEGQRIEFIDCSLLNTLTTLVKPVISLMENTSFTGNSAEILMQRNIFKSKAGAYGTVGAVQCLDYSGDTPTPPSGGGKYLDSYMWSLDYMSEMNSEAIANYSGQ